MKRLIFPAIVLLLAFGACKKGAPPAVPATPSLSVPPKTISVHTILTRSRDTTLNAPDTSSSFDVRDTIHGTIETENALNGTVLIGKWYYEKTGMLIAQSSAELSAGTNLSHFDLVNQNPWPSGQYKLYVLVDSVLKDSAQFSIENRR